MTTSVIDPAWVEDARRGGQDGISQLYYATYQKVYLAIRSAAELDEDTALDLMQDTFVRAFTHLEQLDTSAQFPEWITRLALATVSDYLKQDKERSYDLIPQQVERFEDLDRIATNIWPEEWLERQENMEQIRAIVKALPEQQRLVISMYYYHNMKISGIAAVLGKSEGSIKAVLNTARKQLETQLKISKIDF